MSGSSKEAKVTSKHTTQHRKRPPAGGSGPPIPQQDEGSNNSKIQGSTGAVKGEVKEKGTEIASKDEQVAQLKLGNKELTDLQEELQAKNQQVKQYKKQVDSYKTELERCQKELERCQGELERCHGELKHLQEWPPRDEELEQLRKEKEDLHQTVLAFYQDAETQLSERDLKWQELLNRAKADGDKMQHQYRETCKKHYTQKYLGWCKAMLSEDSDGQRPPVGSAEEADLVEVVREYQERTTEKLRAMEERYLNDIKAYEEGSKKKTKSPAGDSPAVGISGGHSSEEKGPKDLEMVHQRNVDELLKKHEAVMKEKEQLHQVQLEKLKKYYKKKYEEKVQQELGARSGSGSCTPVEVEGRTQQLEEELKKAKGERARLEQAASQQMKDLETNHRQHLKELQGEHEQLMREKMEAHMAELEEVKKRYRKKYEAVVGRVPTMKSTSQSSLDGQDQEVVKVTEDQKKEMDQLMSHVAKQSSAIVELKSLNASLEDVVKQLTEQLEVTRQEKSSAKGSQTLQREVERLREENSSQAKALREVTREREELAGELELMKAQAQTYKEDFLQERKDREQAQTKVSQAEAERSSREEGLMAELQRVKAASSAATADLHTRVLQVEQMKIQIDAYKTDLERCRNELEKQRSVNARAAQEDPVRRQQMEEPRWESERVKQSPNIPSSTREKPVQTYRSSSLGSWHLDHRGPRPSPDDVTHGEPPQSSSDISGVNVQRSLVGGVDPSSHGRPLPPHRQGESGERVSSRGYTRHRSNSLGSLKQMGLESHLQEAAIPHHHPPHQHQAPGMILRPLLPFRADSSNLRASNHERSPLMPVATVPGGHPGGRDLPAARVDGEIIRHQGAHLTGGDEGVSQYDANAPLDPNLTCPYCREGFRKGEIQNYRRHVSSCALTAVPP